MSFRSGLPHVIFHRLSLAANGSHCVCFIYIAPRLRIFALFTFEEVQFPRDSEKLNVNIFCTLLPKSEVEDFLNHLLLKLSPLTNEL